MEYVAFLRKEYQEHILLASLGTCGFLIRLVLEVIFIANELNFGLCNSWNSKILKLVKPFLRVTCFMESL